MHRFRRIYALIITFFAFLNIVIAQSPNNGLTYSNSLQKLFYSNPIRTLPTGKNVKIGVIDVGFEKADETPELEHLFKNKQIVATLDLVTPNSNFFHLGETALDFHGTKVLQNIAGKKENIVIGLAYDALFYLVRTDHGTKETRSDELRLDSALNWLYLQGVRLVNVSLGYTNGFSPKTDDYIPSQMNGKTAISSKIINKYISDYNMIIVTSAGNEGSEANWMKISAPADVEDAISVGAVDNSGLKQGFSSIGFDTAKVQKPDLVAISYAGTSFSAPIVTGIVAGMLENTTYTNAKAAKQKLLSACPIFTNPNNYIGAGMPNIYLLYNNINNKYVEKLRLTESNAFIKYVDSAVVIFHKSGPTKVLQQKLIQSNKQGFEIKRLNNENTFTTVIGNEQVWEIEWINE